jgi:hypothetical protein
MTTEGVTPAEDGTPARQHDRKVARNKAALAMLQRLPLGERNARRSARSVLLRKPNWRASNTSALQQRRRNANGRQKAERAARERRAAEAEQVRIERDQTAAAKGERLASKQAERPTGETSEPCCKKPERARPETCEDRDGWAGGSRRNRPIPNRRSGRSRMGTEKPTARRERTADPECRPLFGPTG